MPNKQQRDSLYALIIDALKNISTDTGLILIPIIALIYLLFYVSAEEIEKFLNINNQVENKEIIIVTPTYDTIIINTIDYSIIDYKYYNINKYLNETN